VNTLLGHASHKESAYEYGRSLVEQIEGFAHELEREKEAAEPGAKEKRLAAAAAAEAEAEAEPVADWGRVTDILRSRVIQRTMNPRVSSSMTSYDVASTIHLACVIHRVLPLSETLAD